ncbi:MAG: MFS transporter [Chloroflexi bacterium]|nr:MFS transporter [Chloroflexota bacterium]
MATQFTEAENPHWKRSFFTIWIGQAFSILGSQIVQFALIWYLARETGSATVLAAATLVAMLPPVVLGPFIGSFVDRGNRRRIMLVADASVALVTIGLAALFYFGLIEVWHIYVMMALRALGGAFHGPAFGASTSLMVPVEFLARLQGINQTMVGGLNIISAPLGALLIETLPMQGVLAVDVVTAIIAIVPLLFVAIPQPERRVRASDGQENTYWEDFREGFTYVWGWKGLLTIILMATAINFLLTPASALTPLLITQHFGGGAIELGWFEAIFSAGVIIGGVALGVWGGFKKRIVTVMVGLIGLGTGMAIIGWAPGNAFQIALGGVVCALMGVWGFTNRNLMNVEEGRGREQSEKEASPEMA